MTTPSDNDADAAELDEQKRGKTGGRTKGTPNKLTANVKAAILAAFEEAGGQAYLLEVAKSDPKTFCSLLAKVLPTQIEAADTEPCDGAQRIIRIIGVEAAPRRQAH